MHQRYNNPHAGMTAPQTQMMGNNDPLLQQMQMLQQQMQQIQQTLQLQPNLPYNQQVMLQQQWQAMSNQLQQLQAAMAQRSMMTPQAMPMMPMGMPQPVNTVLPGNQNVNARYGHPAQQTVPQNQPTTGRYSNPNTVQPTYNQPPMGEHVVETPAVIDKQNVFIVTIESDIKPEYSEKVKFTTVITPIDERAVVHYDADRLNEADTFEAIFAIPEGLDPTAMTLIPSIIYNRVMVSPNTNILSMFMPSKDTDVRGFYKAVGKAYSKEANKLNYGAISRFDQTVTKLINEWLLINLDDEISIDSILDLNELMTALNQMSDLDVSLVDQFNSFLTKVVLADIQVMTQLSEETKLVSESQAIVSPRVEHVLFVPNRIAAELGIQDVPDYYLELEKDVPNNYLLSLASRVLIMTDRPSMYLVTADGYRFKFYWKMDEDEAVCCYIKKV